MKERTIGKFLLAGTLAFGSAGSVAQTEAQIVKDYNCSPTQDQWFPLNQGEIAVVKASGAVVPADVTIDGQKQYDNNPDTATIIGLKSNDNTDKTWVINNDYAGSILVLKCGVGSNATYEALGKQAVILDTRLGLNNPTKSVELNWIKK